MRTPAPLGACHQCCTSPSANWREAREHDLLAQHLRRGPGQRHRVLQLVAEAGGAAGLVEAGLGPQPARHRLVQQPAVDHRVEQRVGRLHGGGAEQRVPARAHRGQRAARPARAAARGGELARGVGAARHSRAGRPARPSRRAASVSARRQRRAGVEPAAAAAGRSGRAAPGGRGRRSTRAGRRSSPRPRRPASGQAEEGGAVAEAGGVLALRAQQRGELAARAGAGGSSAVCTVPRSAAVARPSSTRRCRPRAAAACGGRG